MCGGAKCESAHISSWLLTNIRVWERISADVLLPFPTPYLPRGPGRQHPDPGVLPVLRQPSHQGPSGVRIRVAFKPLWEVDDCYFS